MNKKVTKKETQKKEGRCHKLSFFKLAIILGAVFLVLSSSVFALWFAGSGKRAAFAADYLTEGANFESQQNFAQAYLSYNKASVLDPQNPTPHERLAELLNKASFKTEALEEYKNWSSLAPSNPVPTYYLGKNAFENKNYEEALKYLTQCTNFYSASSFIEPPTVDPFLMLGQIYISRQDLYQAANYLSRTSDLNSEVLLLQVYIIQQNKEAALSLIKSNSVLATSSEQAYAELRKAAVSANRLFQIQTVLKNHGVELATIGALDYVANNPDVRDGLLVLASCQLQQKNLSEAEATILKALEQDPISTTAYQLLYQVYLQQQNSTKLAETKAKAQELYIKL